MNHFFCIEKNSYLIYMKVSLISSFLAFCVNVLVNSQSTTVVGQAANRGQSLTITAANCVALLGTLSAGEKRILTSGDHYGAYSSSKKLAYSSKCVKFFARQAAFGGLSALGTVASGGSWSQSQ